MELKKLIIKLCKAYGPAGDEEEVRDIIIKLIKPYVDKVSVDAMGNLIAFKKGKSGKKIMVSAHMDEIGFMVTHIEKNGLLKVASLGGVRPQTSVYRNISFKNGTQGVTCFSMNKKYEDLKIDDLYVDIGVDNEDEALKHVNVGDCAKFKERYLEIGNRISGPVMDNRVCCATLIKVIEKVQNNKDSIYYVFSAQEEVGLRGATTASFNIEPDVGIALDVTPANDMDKKFTINLGEGAAIKIKDSSLICNPKVVKWLENNAKDNDIKTQREVLSAGGTDAGAIQKTKSGALAGAISIPCRYVHTQRETIDINDTKATIKLLKAALNNGFKK